MLLHNHIYDRLQDDEKIYINLKITKLLFFLFDKPNQKNNGTDQKYQENRKIWENIQQRIDHIMKEYQVAFLLYQKQKKTILGNMLSHFIHVDDSYLILGNLKK